MLYQISNNIVIIALYFSIIDWITYRTVSKNKVFQKVCFLGLAVSAVVLVIAPLKQIAFREIVFIFVCMIWLFLYLSLSDKESGFLYNFMMIISTIMIEIVCRVILALPGSCFLFLVLKNGNASGEKIFLVCADVLLCICILIWGKNIPLYKLYENRGIRIISTVIGIFLIILQQMGTYASDNHQGNLSAITYILFFTIIFSVLWLIDHYRMAAGKLKVEQDNRKMNANLHRTKELMPVLISVVNENKELLDPQIVEEFNQIYSEQMITERKEAMDYKLLGSTGVKLLDAQLQHYILECSKNGISMDAFVAEPIAHVMQDMKIAQLMIHTMVGDLLRNAIRAIERGKVEDGKILVIVGMKEHILEINVFDNGANIPLMVLENFGQRGVTTGGTGNGLADLVKILTDIQASLIIKENAPETSAYTKGFVIVFDGENRRELWTYREKEIKNKVFWNINSDAKKEFLET